jgi:GNAT superfamily N-acetyltransferase
MSDVTARPVEVRPVALGDKDAWFRLWSGYLDFYAQTLSADISATTWRRMLDDDQPIQGLVAIDETGTVVGLVNYVLHLNTWSERPVCYLEDLFVDTAARGQGAGRALIEAVIAQAKTNGWFRVYWQTKRDNATARRLYDAIASVTDWVRYDVTM